MKIEPGQIWRDRYNDRDAVAREHVGTKRFIRVDQQTDDGRWLCETLTDYSGKLVTRSRRTKISEKTLRAGYELQPETSLR